MGEVKAFIDSAAFLNPGLRRTCALVHGIRSARTNKRGQVKFSVMRRGTHVHAHSGPTNCRIRAHLGIRVRDPLGTYLGASAINGMFFF